MQRNALLLAASSVIAGLAFSVKVDAPVAKFVPVLCSNRYSFAGKRPGVWECIDSTGTPRFQQVSADGTRLIPRKTFRLTDDLRAVIKLVERTQGLGFIIQINDSGYIPIR
jgi:hypothetical protein